MNIIYEYHRVYVTYVQLSNKFIIFKHHLLLKIVTVATLSIYVSYAI